MTQELGMIDKPDAAQFAGKKKIYLVGLIYTWQDAPPEYAVEFNVYWDQVKEHITNLESTLGKVDRVYHESISAGGEDGLKTLEKLSSASHQIIRAKVEQGAQLESLEDAKLVEEGFDWERHIILGFVSERAAIVVAEALENVLKQRYEYIAHRIGETLKDGEAGLLFLREGHAVQFPTDVEIFSVSPPALDNVHRWLREH